MRPITEMKFKSCDTPRRFSVSQEEGGEVLKKVFHDWPSVTLRCILFWFYFRTCLVTLK